MVQSLLGQERRAGQRGVVGRRPRGRDGRHSKALQGVGGAHVRGGDALAGVLLLGAGQVGGAGRPFRILVISTARL